MRRNGRGKKEGKVAMDDETMPATMRRAWMRARGRGTRRAVKRRGRRRCIAPGYLNPVTISIANSG